MEHHDIKTTEFIRSKGYRLFSRPCVGEPLWQLRYSDGSFSLPQPQGVILDMIEEWEKSNKHRRRGKEEV